MSALTVEQRLSVLEAEVKRLKGKVEGNGKAGDPWMDVVRGAFANDPDFEKAMQYGREYRESLRPKPKKRKRKTQSK